jgi:hypothetical protein
MRYEIDVDAGAGKRFEREFGLGIIADPPHDADTGSKTRQRDGHIAGHATRCPRRDNATDTLLAMPPGARRNREPFTLPSLVGNPST